MTCRKSFQRTKFACYSAYFTMSSIFALPPILFVTFHEMYDVSYTLLGTLVLTNFCTQLLIDLVFSFFSKYFNVKLAVRVMPILTSVGLFLYAMAPVLFPNAIFWGSSSVRSSFRSRQDSPRCSSAPSLPRSPRTIRKGI